MVLAVKCQIISPACYKFFRPKSVSYCLTTTPYAGSTQVLDWKTNLYLTCNYCISILVSSLCKKWSTIVRLLPCSRTSASELFPITKQIISDIENCDLQVQVLCTDNYPLNVRLFKCFSPSATLEPTVPHPIDSASSLNLIFDFVYIMKTIRNNWLNQKDVSHTFIFPKFDNFSLSNEASFEDMRLFFKTEQHNVAKTAHRLTMKFCWPVTL